MQEKKGCIPKTCAFRRFVLTEQTTLFQTLSLLKATHRRTRKGRASGSSSAAAPTPPAKCSYQHKPPMETLKSPLRSQTTRYLFLDLHVKANRRQAGKLFNRPAQRKPAKGNGAPQSAYPVSAAFNRMSLMHRLLYL